jgi:hypothetical protein
MEHRVPERKTVDGNAVEEFAIGHSATLLRHHNVPVSTLFEFGQQFGSEDLDATDTGPECAGPEEDAQGGPVLDR